jgi:hypothetical protein
MLTLTKTELKKEKETKGHHQRSGLIFKGIKGKLGGKK